MNMQSPYRILPYKLASHSFSRVLTQEQGNFIGRIGGSDWDLVSYYYFKIFVEKSFTVEEIVEDAAFQGHVRKAKQWNGYYDLTDNPEKSIAFCERYLAICSKMNLATVGNGTFLSALGMLKEGQVGYNLDKDGFYRSSPINSVVTCELVNFNYIENLIGFFCDFFQNFSGKKILVCSPFVESFKKQFEYRGQLFSNHPRKNFRYPDFDLLTLTTPITYDGVLSYPHQDWFQTCEALCAEIDTLDFDIALLSCGSYAMELGDFVRKRGKRAVYIGGPLQLFFGVAGRRYLTVSGSFYKPFMNEFWIRPIEEPQVMAEEGALTEAWGAYW